MLQRIVLRGDYSGFRDASIRYRFRFCDDGIYFYLAERADHDYTLWQLAHRGRWELSEAPHPRNRDRRLNVLQLEPEFLDIEPGERESIPMLRERGLPSNRLEKYLISAVEFPGGGRPRPENKTYYCTIPDPRQRFEDVSWHLESA